MEAISKVSAGKVAAVAATVSDEDSAAQTASVDIPLNPARGVRLVSGGQTSTIGLPDASKLADGERLASGMVAYRNSNGSAIVAVPTTQGTVQFLIVAETADAPEDYAFPMGQDTTSVQTLPDGSALGLSSSGQPTMLFPAPWAEDAAGASVPTNFAATGNTLTQHIAHKAADVSYPVVADPFFIPAVIVWKIIRCGAGGYLGWIAAAGWDWWWRALAIVGSCLVAI